MTWFGYIMLIWLVFMVFAMINGLKDAKNAQARFAGEIAVFVVMALYIGTLFVGTGHVR